jgi:hypothetical protein
MAREARERNIPPERLLVCLNEIWESVISALQPASREERLNLRGRLITLCVESYFTMSVLVAVAGTWFPRLR